ncbi:hypothetical protein QPM17_10455 [Marinobacter sp. TBZ242]|uniref:Uncharacterized protein n=1 Tax=Marinobacter azerbaijanicus TaxID=3050455 RepID=A0ABT7IBM5_9GAMM|nr:hypothetical protein [Marinobacter sp. TBZ242]MDL0431552.1 hypothetical protein [Marinobacter sp. TBZ242]
MAKQYSTMPSSTEIDYYIKLAKAERNQYIADKTTALVKRFKAALRYRFQIVASKQSPSH